MSDIVLIKAKSGFEGTGQGMSRLGLDSLISYIVLIKAKTVLEGKGQGILDKQCLH